MAYKLLNRVLRKYLMHLACKLGQMVIVESILTHLILLGTFRRFLCRLEIQEHAILLHTAGQQQAFIAQYVTPARFYHPVDRSKVLGNIIPVLPLSEHHKSHLDDDKDTPHQHEQEQGDVLA